MKREIDCEEIDSPTKYCARAYNNIIGPEDDTRIGKICKKFNKIVHYYKS